MTIFFKHLRVVNKHRFLVFRFACKAGIPWRGLIHDLSKYGYTEFSESIKYFNGKKSPLAICKQETGHSLAWCHHKGRNKHHFEYYIDIDAYDRTPIIPYKYAVEMICDTMAAGMTYMGYDWSPKKQLEYLNKRRDTDYLNVKIYRFLERVYLDIDKYGIDKVINKNNLKKIYDEIINSPFLYKCYLGGTVYKTNWRDKFIKLLDDESIKCFNPVSDNWNHEVEVEHNRIKKDCEYIIYVITKETKGYLAIANAVSLSGKTPNRILTCFITDGMSKEQKDSLDEVEKIILNSRSIVFHSLEELVTYVKEH